MADYRGMQVPMPRMVPVHYWPPCVALTDRALWLSNAGATRRFPLDHIVLASPAPSPDGAMRVDFMSGDPLIVLVVDNGSFWGRLGRAIRAVDVRLQMAAPDALGVPELSPEKLAAAERAETRAHWLLAEYGDVPNLRLEAARHAEDARALRHEARVDALREQRTELLAHASQKVSGGGS